MITINVDVGRHQLRAIAIGRRGEKNARTIVFDVSQFVRDHGEGTPVLLYKRKGDDVPYMPTIVRHGNEVWWTVTDTDTSVTGYGEAELQWRNSEEQIVAKTMKYSTQVDAALENPGDTSSAVETALDELTERVESAAEDVAAARAAKTAAQAAQVAAETARGAAQEAAGNAALSATAAHTDALGASGSAETAAEKALSVVTVGEQVLENVAIVECASTDGQYWFAFREMTPEEIWRAEIENALCELSQEG